MLLELAPEQQGGRRHDRPRHVPQDPVDARPELRADQGEPPRLIGQPHRVGVGPDGGGAVAPRAGHDERSRADLVPRGLADGIGLAGQQGLVHLEAVGPEHLAVDDDLVARHRVHDVVEDEVRRRQLADVARAHRADGRRGQHLEPLQGPLRAELLDDPDRRVRHEHQPEQGIAVFAHGEDHDEHRAEQRVEPREQVGSDDLGGRAGGRRGDVVRRTGSDARADLILGEPPRRVDGHRHP